MLTTVRSRLAAATGAAYVVLVGVGNQINVSGTDQSTHPTGEAVLRDVGRQVGSTSATIGFLLELCGFVAFIAFLGYLVFAMLGRRSDGAPRLGVAGGTAVVAGVTMLAIKLGSAAPIGVLVLDRTTISPQLAQVLNDMNSVAFVVGWLPYAVFVAGAALGLRRAELVGRPTAYIGAAIGVIGVAATAIGLHSPLGANPMPFLLGLLWTLAVSVRLAVRPGARARAAASSAISAQSAVAATGA